MFECYPFFDVCVIVYRARVNLAFFYTVFYTPVLYFIHIYFVLVDGEFISNGHYCIVLLCPLESVTNKCQ